MDSSAQTSSTHSSEKPLAKTERRPSSCCSRAVSSLKLHSMVSRSVRCRASVFRVPPVSRAKLVSSRSAICSGVSTFTRAAASSIASGMPSSRQQMRATAAALAGVSVKPAQARLRTVDEELDRFGLADAFELDTARVGQRQRRHEPRALAFEAERLAAGRHDRQRRAGPQQRLRQLRAGVDQVLAIVEDEQRGIAFQLIDDRLEHGPGAVIAHADGRGDVLGERTRIHQRGQLGPDDAAGEQGARVARELDGEPGLAAAAGAGQREQPRRDENRRALLQFVRSADQAGERDGQLRSRQRSPFQRVAGSRHVRPIFYASAPGRLPLALPWQERGRLRRR